MFAHKASYRTIIYRELDESAAAGREVEVVALMADAVEVRLSKARVWLCHVNLVDGVVKSAVRVDVLRQAMFRYQNRGEESPPRLQRQVTRLLMRINLAVIGQFLKWA